MERTLVILKPDAVQRCLVGKIIGRFEDRGLKLIGMKLMQIPRSLAEKHYAVHQGKPFFEPLLDYITSGAVVVLAIEGPNAIEVVRAMMGSTDGSKAPSGTIRGDYGLTVRYNLVHGSDSAESAATELALFFADDELVQYARCDECYTGPEALK